MTKVALKFIHLKTFRTWTFQNQRILKIKHQCVRARLIWAFCFFYSMCCQKNGLYISGIPDPLVI